MKFHQKPIRLIVQYNPTTSSTNRITLFNRAPTRSHKVAIARQALNFFRALSDGDTLIFNVNQSLVKKNELKKYFGTSLAHSVYPYFLLFLDSQCNYYEPKTILLKMQTH